jgi:GT2 family glycosyltransferase
VQLWGGGKVHFCTGAALHQVGPAQLDYLSGASMLLRREAIEQVGLFDDRKFFMYWEDSDLGFRLRHAGWQLTVAEKSHVWHKLSASLGRGSCQLDQYFTRSGVRFFRQYSSNASLSVLMMIGRMVLKRVFIGDFNRVKSVWQGYLSA